MTTFEAAVSPYEKEAFVFSILRLRPTLCGGRGGEGDAAQGSSKRDGGGRGREGSQKKAANGRSQGRRQEGGGEEGKRRSSGQGGGDIP